MSSANPSGERVPASPFDRESLTVAMAVVPGLYSRNKMFTLFTDPDVKLARTRAAILRGIVRHLASSRGEPGASSVELVREGGLGQTCLLRYRLRQVRMERRVELSETEVACVLYLCGRAGVTSLRASERDRALIDVALARLAMGLCLSGIER
jgi:hypothetical protein